MPRRPILLAAALALLLPLPLPVAAQTEAEADSAAAEARREDGLPLIPTRTMEFTVDEGTWISLDLSPDGRTIVFELLGDLYTLPVEGGEATRVTSGQAYDMQPRFSPDGARIVFVSDRDGSENVWTANADGSDPEALTSGERESYVSPIWVPGEPYVMATKGSQLWLWHTEGGSGVQVTGKDEDDPGPTGGFLGAAFADDPRYVWVNVRGSLGGGFDLAVDHATEALRREPGAPHGPRSSAREVGAYQIGLYDRDTGRTMVRTHEMEGAFRPLPSPDGRWLVYATRWDAREALKLLDLETGEETWLVMDVQRDDSQGGGSRDRDVYPGSAWTPASDAIITSYGGKIWRVAVPSGEVTPVPFTARVEQELGPLVKFDYPIDDSLHTVSQIRGARPSPDGSRLAFTALDRLYVADLPAGLGGPGAEAPGEPLVIGDAVRLTDTDDVEHAPVFSPDGRWVAWVSWNDSVGGHIWRAPADGSGEPVRVTPEAAFYDKITYSSDGSRLVAVRGSRLHRMRTLEDFGRHTGAAELEYVWMPAEGGEATRIAWVGAGTTQQGRNAPHVGPDPDRIYVWTGSDGLISVRYDGTDPKTVVHVAGPRSPGGGAGSPNEVVLSPDGTRAVVQSNRNVYLITVPRVGGEPPTVTVGGSSVVPTRRLTDIGGDFVGWRADGASLHWSIGRSFLQWDVALADSLFRAEAEADDEEEAEEAAEAAADTVGGAAEEDPQEDEEDEDDEDDPPAYEPFRADIEIVALKDKPRGTVVLQGARIITMRGDEVIESGDLVVRDNRIEAIGATGTVSWPDDARVIDASETTITPGLVDIHAHTWVAWGLHRNQVSQFMAQLAWGVTTQRDPQTSSEDALTYYDLAEVGEVIAPRLYSTGPGIFGSDAISSLDEARDVVRRYSDHFDTKTIKQYLAGDRKIRQWVITAAREQGLTPTTEGGSNFTMNLTLMQDGYAGLEHALPIAPIYDDVVELTRFSGIAYTPTLVVAYGGPSGLNYWLTRTDVDTVDRLRYFTPHDELDKWQDLTWYREDQYVHPLHAEGLTKIVEAGGRVGLGSHGEVQGLGTHWELWMMASGGMDPHDALRAATLHSADAIGLDGDLGSLEVGKLADLMVLEANPLDDIHNTDSVRWVMKNGRLYEAGTLTEIWPRQRPLETQWWWRVEPPGERPGGA